MSNILINVGSGMFNTVSFPVNDLKDNKECSW